MKNYYNIDFSTGIVDMRCWDTQKKEYVSVKFDQTDLKKVDAACRANWRVIKTSPSNPGSYAQCSDGRTTIYLHRLIATPKQGLEVSHINSNSLDNTRENLECITPSKHRFKDACKGNTAKPWSKTGMRGVRQMPNGSYQAFYSDRVLGYFDRKEDAQITARQFREWITAIRNKSYVPVNN